MDNKRDKTMAAQLMVEKLGSIKGITSKAMFGGFGIFKDGAMFCIVDKNGQYYFRANETNMADFENEGSVKHSRMPYYIITDDVFNDHEKLLIWAEKCIAGLK